MDKLILIILIVFLIEAFISPRLDYTKNKKLLLWYGNAKRKYIILW